MYLIMYDIAKDKIRTKVSKMLVSAGYERIQLSVFAGPDDPKANTKLWLDIEKIMSKEPAAKLFVIEVLERKFLNMHIIGNFDIDLDYLTGQKLTMII